MNKEDRNRVNIIPPEVLIEAYSRGIFPMADSRNDPEIQWYTARRRGVIPLDRFHVSKKVKRMIHGGGKYRWSVNEDFRNVMERCADRETTWISERIIESYVVLHRMGYAHSVEIYEGEHMTGGLYGVTLRSAFFAESMFQRSAEKSKIALYHCHEHLKKRDFRLWDVQFFTPHLKQFGCVEIDETKYHRQLKQALRYPAKFDG